MADVLSAIGHAMSSKTAELWYANTRRRYGLFFDHGAGDLRKNRGCFGSDALRPAILDMLGNKTRLARTTLRTCSVVKHQFFYDGCSHGTPPAMAVPGTHARTRIVECVSADAGVYLSAR
jgi:hypothetical protein